MGLLPGARQRASAALLFAAAFTSAALLMAGCGSKPVAQVNGLALSEKEFAQLCENATQLDSRLGSVGKQVLTQWIAAAVLEQEAKHQGVYPSEKDLEARVDAFRRQAAWANSSMEDQLKIRGTSLDAMKKETLRQLIAENVMMRGVTVSDAEIKAAWDKQKQDFVQPETVEISQITVESPEEMKKVQSDLGGNADFALVARTRSQDQFKDNGGKVAIGPLPRKVPPGMPVTQEAVDAAFKMKPGQISDPIKVGATWVIVRLENKTAPKQPNYEDFREYLRMQLRHQKAQQSGALQKNQQELQNAQRSAKVEINRPEYASLLNQRNTSAGPAGAPGAAGGDMPPGPPGD